MYEPSFDEATLDDAGAAAAEELHVCHVEEGADVATGVSAAGVVADGVVVAAGAPVGLWPPA